MSGSKWFRAPFRRWYRELQRRCDSSSRPARGHVDPLRWGCRGSVVESRASRDLRGRSCVSPIIAATAGARIAWITSAWTIARVRVGESPGPLPERKWTLVRG